MTHKYERQCWYCGSTDMQDMGNYALCRKCGATWTKVPAVGGATLLSEEVTDCHKELNGERISGTPSRSVQSQAAAARRKKQEPASPK